MKSPPGAEYVRSLASFPVKTAGVVLDLFIVSNHDCILVPSGVSERAGRYYKFGMVFVKSTENIQYGILLNLVSTAYPVHGIL